MPKVVQMVVAGPGLDQVYPFGSGRRPESVLFFPPCQNPFISANIVLE